MTVDSKGPTHSSRHRAIRRPKASRDVVREKRRQGRPNSQSDGVGRQALVEATRELLRTKGPALVTRTDIARHAGVDPGLIRYYFGDKSRLFAEVIMEILAEMRKKRNARSQMEGPRERLKRRLADSVRLFQENPFHHPLVVELIFSGLLPQARKMWRQDVVHPALSELEALFDEGVRKKLLRRVDPRFLHLLIVAAGEFYAGGRAVLVDMFGASAVNADLEKAYVEFLYDLFMFGMAPR